MSLTPAGTAGGFGAVGTPSDSQGRTSMCFGPSPAPGGKAVFALAKETFAAMENEYLPMAEAREVPLVDRGGETAGARQQGIEGKAMYADPLRVALTGRAEGADLYYLVGGRGKSMLLSWRERAAA